MGQQEQRSNIKNEKNKKDIKQEDMHITGQIEAKGAPYAVASPDEKWVQEYKKQFGCEPGFF